MSQPHGLPAGTRCSKTVRKVAASNRRTRGCDIWDRARLADDIPARFHDLIHRKTCGGMTPQSDTEQPGRERPQNARWDSLARGRRGRSRPCCCTDGVSNGRQKAPPVPPISSAASERQVFVLQALPIITPLHD